MFGTVDRIGIAPMKMNLLNDVIFALGEKMFDGEMMLHIDLRCRVRKPLRSVQRRSIRRSFTCVTIVDQSSVA